PIQDSSGKQENIMQDSGIAGAEDPHLNNVHPQKQGPSKKVDKEPLPSFQDKTSNLSSDSSSEDDSDAIPNTQLADNMESEEDIFAAQLQAQDNKVKSQLNEDSGKPVVKPSRRAHRLYKMGIKTWRDLLNRGHPKFVEELQGDFRISDRDAAWCKDRISKWMSPSFGEMRGQIGSSKGEEEVGKEEGSDKKEDDTDVAASDLEDSSLFEISRALKKESSSTHDYVANTLCLTDGMEYDVGLQILKQATEEWRKTVHID
ncbi:hypothetical protein L7F22_025597, partial [Adiantum nelumboides]|nr:hypothetical protein [Adiantum nelumboides]